VNDNESLARRVLPAFPASELLGKVLDTCIRNLNIVDLPQELRVPNTAGILADRIRQLIVQGRLRPGEILRQEALAERFGVSRSPVREALRLLESEGLVLYRPNRGAVVAAAEVPGAREHFQIRRLLEPALIEHAVRAIDERSLDELAELHASLCEERDPTAFVRLHWQFHESIYRHARRPLTVNVVYRSQIHISYRPDLDAIVAALRASSCAIDERILAACRRGDSQDAIELTLRHIDDTELVVLPILPQPERSGDDTPNAG